MNLFRPLAAASLALALAAPLAALADATAAKKALEGRFPNDRIEGVSATPFPGLYEAVIQGPRGKVLVYTDAKADYMMVGGSLLDLRTQPYKDLTEAAMEKVRAAAAKENSALLKTSLDMAVKRVKGNGKRTLITFEDPNCSYCRQLQNELVKLDNVTIYTFLWPFLAESSLTKSQAVWCAKDRGEKFEAVMLRNDAAKAPAGCEYPHATKVSQMAQKLGLSGTPAIFLADGTEYAGPRSAAALDKALSAN
ncbi:MAG TPA: DsbC family protein [Pelomicrobium sp.]|nr:DsbC family protein [Pelomicrobium sp.]